MVQFTLSTSTQARRKKYEAEALSLLALLQRARFLTEKTLGKHSFLLVYRYEM
jgi:hypothetical protein